MAEGFRKFGSTALRGYIHLGWAEFQTLAPHAESPHAVQSNYFMPFTPTPGEIAEVRRDEALTAEEELAPAKNERSREDRGRDDPGMDIDI
jgi:hypothetical protein